MASLSNFLFGSSPKMKQVPTMNPQQQQLFSQLMQMLGGQGGIGQGQQESTDLLRQYLDPSSEAVQQFTDPYMQEFNQRTVPGLAERFAGAGAMGGGLSSSGFGQSLSAAGGNLQSQLAALRAGLGQQAAGQLMNQYGNMSQGALSQRPFGYTYQPGSQGFLGNLAAGYAQGGFPGIGGAASGLYNRMFQQSNPFMANQAQMGIGGF